MHIMDEKAHLSFLSATIGLHRPLSDLRFNPVEWISSCARSPPRENPTPELINVHTVRVLKSTEAQILLLTLPTERFHHSPFTTCMVSEGTLALLSACSYLFKGKELAIARDQIRMTIGCLKALGQLWPRTARNVREIQTIARQVLLRLGSNATDQDIVLGSSDIPNFLSDQGQIPISEPEADTSLGDIDISDPLLGDMEDVCGWFNSREFQGQDLPWWTSSNES